MNIGERMKEYYEKSTRLFLPRRNYGVVRVDGRAFHTYTKGCDRPFDLDLYNAMRWSAEELCSSISGTKLAFIQSDEISVVFTDFDNRDTQMWFDGNIQKIASISSSIATAGFSNWLIKNNCMKKFGNKLPIFDARVFTISNIEEVINYLIWRQQDYTRNSISMVARTLYSHKELCNKNTSQMQDMIFEKGINWNDYPNCFKRGTLLPINMVDGWIGGSMETPIFTADKQILREILTPKETA